MWPLSSQRRGSLFNGVPGSLWFAFRKHAPELHASLQRRSKIHDARGDPRKRKPIIKMMRWGLIPSWAKDESIADSLKNAKADTLAQKPSFRSAYQRRRCLIPMDGFYEWQPSGTTKIPFRIATKDESIFCVAGLWERWVKPPVEGEFPLHDLDTPEPSRVFETFTIITTEPNPMMARIHHRMPVIVSKEHWDWWIDTESHDGASVRFILRPYPAEDMQSYRVSSLVNNSRNESPKCLEPA